MSRLQLALTVSDVDQAVDFYERMFATPVAKRRPGYANFAIADPPLKLVLIEGDAAGGLNHLGVETMDADELSSWSHRWTGAELTEVVEDAVECCYAVQDKAWTSDPDGVSWEVYTVLADAPATEAVPMATVGACGTGAGDACGCGC